MQTDDVLPVKNGAANIKDDILSFEVEVDEAESIVFDVEARLVYLSCI